MKYRKILRTLALALTLALLLAAVPSTPALAYDEEIDLDPNRGEIGDTITITGSDFNAGSGTTIYAAAIYFAEDEAVLGERIDDDVDTYERVDVKPIDSWGEFVTTFDVPAVLNDGTDDEDVSIGTYYIYVTYDYYNADTGQHTYSPFIDAMAVFTVSSGDIILDPDSGVVGTEVEVTGDGFDDDEDIEIEYDSKNITDDIIDGEAETDNDGEFEFTIVIPESTAGDHTITVTGDDSGSEATAEFTVEPEITLSPTSGPSGTEVTVTGTGFGRSSDIEYVEFDRDEVDIESGDYDTDRYGSFECTFLVPPEDLDTYDLEVEDEDGNTADAEFTILIASTASLSLTTGNVGTEVTVSGTSFKASNTVTITFNNEQVATTTTDNIGSFSASFNIPPAPGGTHEVKISDGTNTATANFKTSPSASLSETEGYVGSDLTVSGTGFQASKPISITFDTKQVVTTTTDNNGSLSASFIVPTRVTGTYVVRISDDTNTITANFKIGTSATISQTTGHVGSQLTVSGIGFAVGKTVTVTYGNTKVAVATVSTDGTFSATFNAPASIGGKHVIAVTDGTITQQFTFTMESDLPTPPKPLSPEMATKAKAQAYLDWENVTDPSGITYSLQIATDADFSEDSIVLEKTGLATSEYTITKEERLKSVSKDTPYYWHVMTVDGASNKSLWSGVGTFYVGFQFSLSQPVIYALFGVGALLFGIIGFWLGRRTIDLY